MKRQTSFLQTSKAFTAIVFSLLTVLTPHAEGTAADTNQDSQVEQVATDSTDVDHKLFAKALRVIKKAIKRAESAGTPYRVSCRYDLKDNKPVAAATEVHYSDYRKKADSQSVEFSKIEGKADRVVEFLYKPNSRTLAVLDRDPSRPSRRLATRKTIQIDI